MQALLEHFITQSTVYSLMAVVLVALESLALVGLILPGTVLMAGAGALIGSGELSSVARLAGRDCQLCWATGSPSGWAGVLKSVCIAGHFWRKTKHYSVNWLCVASTACSQWSVLCWPTTRPLVPMVAKVLDLPVAIHYAEYYRLPAVAFVFTSGILAGAAIDIPAECRAASLNKLLLAAAVFVWVGGWLCWRLWRSGKATDRLSHYLHRAAI